MQIRLAVPGDLPAMREIYRPYVEETTITFEYETPSEEEFAARFAAVTAWFPWFVAEENGQVLGYAYAARAFERAAYQWDADVSIYLSPAAQGRGIGRALYQALEKELYTMGYCTLYALITAENAASCAFHRAMGYTLCATLPASGFKHGRWLDVYWYEKALRTKPVQPQPVRPFCRPGK